MPPLPHRARVGFGKGRRLQAQALSGSAALRRPRIPFPHEPGHGAHEVLVVVNAPFLVDLHGFPRPRAVQRTCQCVSTGTSKKEATKVKAMCL